MTAIRVDMQTAQTDEDRVRMWFAADMGFVPVQIQIEDTKGKAVTQKLIQVR
ncbi:MAG: hypothetical protein HC848_09980 [Limnobacter sp.]|nr:hypothetical protein [Limnobacter sp.]